MLFRKKKEVKPELYTEESCQACGEKWRRQFRDGDYVFAAAAACGKCSSANTLINAIYGEYPPETDKN